VKRILILAVVLLSSVAFALPVTAGSIDSTIDGPWLQFFFLGGAGTYAVGCSYCGGQSAGQNQVFLGPAPWTLDLAAPAELKITDILFKGDSFRVYDYGVLKLTTPPVDIKYHGSDCGSDPENCYGVEGVSYGMLRLDEGPHSLTIQVADSPYGQGAGHFRIDRIIATPEPGSMLLLALGMIGIGVLRKRTERQPSSKDCMRRVSEEKRREAFLLLPIRH
jgi:hypothetical protein